MLKKGNINNFPCYGTWFLQRNSDQLEDNDRSTPNRKCKKIADYFNVPIEYFYSDENKKELPTSNEEFVNMLRNHNQGKAQVFFCGADGKVIELSPEEEAIMQNLIKLRKDNK